MSRFTQPELRDFNGNYFLLICLLLILSSCGEESLWSEALQETAPGTPVEIKPPRQEQAPERGATVTRPSAQTEARELSGLATVTFRITQYPQVSAGAVRLIMNRQYKGVFDAQGSVQVQVEAGRYEIDIYDSAGKWQLTRTFSPGQNVTITVVGRNKQTFESGSDDAGPDDAES